MKPNTLYAVLEALKPILKSIDIRTVAVTQPNENFWENLVTSIIVSTNSVDEVKSKQEELPALLTHKNGFAIFYDARHFDYTIFDQISKGEIRVLTPYGTNRILFRQFDPLELLVNSIQEFDAQAATETSKWILRSEASGQSEERAKFWSIVDNQNMEAKKLGFPQGINDLINKSLEITDFAFKRLRDFIITIPNLPRIEDAFFVNSSFKIKIKTFGLKDLQINPSIARVLSGNRIYNWISPISLKEGKQEELVTIELPGLKPFDEVNAELIHTKSALTMDKISGDAPLQNVVEPLTKTLNAFCQLEHFKNMLLEPVKSKPPESIFETAVTWLLSMAGFCTIHLGKKFEKLRMFGTECEVGSADIIAYRENESLLLVDCTIGVPEDEKIQKIYNTTKRISDLLKDLQGLLIVPVVFSAEDCGQLERRAGVKIVDKTMIESMFKKVMRGEPESARSIILEQHLPSLPFR